MVRMPQLEPARTTWTLAAHALDKDLAGSAPRCNNFKPEHARCGVVIELAQITGIATPALKLVYHLTGSAPARELWDHSTGGTHDMRLYNERPSDNIEDRRGQGGGFGFPRGGGGGFRVPMGRGGGGISLQTIILLVAIYLIAKFVFGVDLIQVITGDQTQPPPGQQQSETQQPPPGDQSTQNNQNTGSGQQTGQQTTDVTGDAGRDFVARILGSTERVWTEKFQQMGRQYQKPTLVLFSGFVQSACGMAQAAMGPFYCPGDNKVYIDLSFYQDMKNKLGAPGDFAAGLCDRSRGRPPYPERSRHRRQGAAGSHAVLRGGSQRAFGPHGASGRLPGRRLGEDGQ